MTDHDYSLLAHAVDDEVEEIEADDLLPKEKTINLDHTPIKAPNPKKKKKDKPADDTMDSILKAVFELTGKMDKQIVKLDAQTDLLKKFEAKIEANSEAIRVNKLDIGKMQKKMDELQAENKRLNEAILEQARYKRRWNLRLNGLPEKDGEDTREVVIGILTRVVPLSVEKLREAVDTVHRLGVKGTAATSNNRPRSIIIQFAMRTVKDEIWKRSREAIVCKELHIYFKKDYIKEDREARAKLYPLVQEARKKGLRAYLLEGYAMIDGRRVDPPE